MKRKTILCILLVAALLASLAACGQNAPQPASETVAPATEGPEATAAPTASPEPEDPQMAALFQMLSAIRQEGTHEWRYAVTDLDHNGRPELIAASQHQADRSTTLSVWELSESMDALTECAIPLQEGESFPDILAENADTFHDPVTDTWSYLFYDNILLSESDAYTAKCAVTLRDQTVSYQSFAFQMVSVQNGQRSVEYMDLEGREISPEAFNAA